MTFIVVKYLDVALNMSFICFLMYLASHEFLQLALEDLLLRICNSSCIPNKVHGKINPKFCDRRASVAYFLRRECI